MAVSRTKVSIPTERSSACGGLDLLDGQATVFLVEPDGIVAAQPADRLDHLGQAQLAHDENTNQLTLGQRLFQTHRVPPGVIGDYLGRAEPSGQGAESVKHRARGSAVRRDSRHRGKIAAGSGPRRGRADRGGIVGQARVKQVTFRLDSGEPLIPQNDRAGGHILQPVAIGSCLGRLLAFPAIKVNGQAEDNLRDQLVSHEMLIELSVRVVTAAPIRGQWRGDAPIRVAYRQANADAAVVHAEQPAGSHRYFSRSVAFICSTSRLIRPSASRPATSSASPSCTITRFSTPAVAMR